MGRPWYPAGVILLQQVLTVGVCQRSCRIDETELFSNILCFYPLDRDELTGGGMLFRHDNYMSYDGSICVHLVGHCAERLEFSGDGLDLTMGGNLDFCVRTGGLTQLEFIHQKLCRDGFYVTIFL